MILDVDCTYEHTNEIIIAVLHGLKRIFGNSHAVVYGQYTDSGGGGIDQELFRTLSALGITCHKKWYPVCCTIYKQGCETEWNWYWVRVDWMII